MENNIDYNWDKKFTELFGKCMDFYKEGNKDYKTYFSIEEFAFLKSIGYSPIEFYDFVDDFMRYGEPSICLAVLIASVRRDYLNVIQKGQSSDKKITPQQLPAKNAKVGYIAWLPRLIIKAQAKLKGQMNNDLMFSCSGDRKFFKHFDINPADFLRLSWAAGNDSSKIIEFVKNRAKIKGIPAQYDIKE